MLIINDEQLLMVGDESTKIYVAIIHIIIPILIIRYVLKKNQDDIISIEVVLIFATFLGRIIYNNSSDDNKSRFYNFNNGISKRTLS